MFAILAGRGFRRLLAVRVSSQLGDGWFQAGLAGSLLFNPEQQAGPVAIAAGFATLLLPYSLLGPYVGVLLDRWQRRNSLCLANLARAAAVVPTAILLWYGHDGGTFAAFALLVIAANRFFLAGLSASLPHVVTDDQLVAGNAMASTLGTISYATGLGTAAALLSSAVGQTDRHGYAAIALLGSAAYLLSAGLLAALFRRTALGPDDAERRTDATLAALVEVARGMVAGVRHLAARRAAALAFAVQAGHRLLAGVLTLALLLLFTRYFASADTGGALSGLGLVVAAGGGGVLAAAVVTPMATRRMPGWAWIATVLGGAGVALLVLVPPFRAPLLLVGVFMVNMASQSTKIVVDTILQHECEDAFRGRVFSINDTAFNGALVAGLFAAALLLPSNGRSLPAVVLVAVGYGGLAAWYAAVARHPKTAVLV